MGEPLTLFRIVNMLGLLLVQSACSGYLPPSVFDVGGGVSDPSVHALAAKARGGDREALFDLAVAYESGSGLAPNARKARAIYGHLAIPDDGRRGIYIPPIGDSVPAQVDYIQVDRNRRKGRPQCIQRQFMARGRLKAKAQKGLLRGGIGMMMRFQNKRAVFRQKV